MKNLFLVAVFVITATCVNAQNYLGGGLQLGTKAAISSEGVIDELGVGLDFKGVFSISETFALSPSVVYYFPSSVSGSNNGTSATVDLRPLLLSLDAHYNFVKSENSKVYLLAGLNYSYMSLKADVQMSGASGSGTESEGKVGANIGAGMSTKMGKRSLFFIEAAYSSEFEQAMLSAGFLFQLGKK